MKKILVLLVLLYGHLFALEKGSTLKIYHEIFMSALHKEKIKVYTSAKELKEVFRTSHKIILVNTPDLADIVVVDTDRSYQDILKQMDIRQQKKIPFFATHYQVLAAYDNVIGALYWKKGRSQLLFVKPRLERFGITLSSEYKPFIVDEL